MEVESATQSICWGDPGVDRQHLIFISSCHITKIHTLSFPTFGLTRSVHGCTPLRGSSPPGRIISTPFLATPLKFNAEGMLGEFVAASLLALQSRCKQVPNETVPMYSHCWPRRQPECLK